MWPCGAAEKREMGKQKFVEEERDASEQIDRIRTGRRRATLVVPWVRVAVSGGGWRAKRLHPVVLNHCSFVILYFYFAFVYILLIFEIHMFQNSKLFNFIYKIMNLKIVSTF